MSLLGVKSFRLVKGLSESKHDGVRTVVARFEIAKRLSQLQPSLLMEYVSLIPGDNQQIFIVSEHGSLTIRKWRERISSSPAHVLEEHCRRMFFMIIRALEHMHRAGLVHRALSADNVLVEGANDGSGSCLSARLSDFGFHFITDSGRLVQFPTGHPAYMSPEDLLRPCECKPPAPSLMPYALPEDDTDCCDPLASVSSSALDAIYLNGSFQGNAGVHVSPSFQTIASPPTVDIWALGLLMIEVITGAPLWNESRDDAASLLSRAFWLCGRDMDTSDGEDDEDGSAEKKHNSRVESLLLKREFQGISAEMKDVIRLCLTLEARLRPSSGELLHHPYFADLWDQVSQSIVWSPKPFLHCGLLEEGQAVDNERPSGLSISLKSSSAFSDDPLASCTPLEVYHLWCLDDGNAATAYKKATAKPPPLFRMPSVLRAADFIDGCFFEGDPWMKYDDKIYAIDLTHLRKCLESSKNLAPLEMLQHPSKERPCKRLPPRAVREKSAVYQFHRLQLFKALLARYPASHRDIIREAKVDIPPLLRGEIWSIVLQIQFTDEALFETVDKESEGPSDHQIDLDIPRCHQYDPLLSSQEGRKKMRRLLKAWVSSNPSFVYWQGLDSLLAPFLTLNFHDEARCFCCLQEIVRKYLNNFFLKGNASSLQGRLVVFRQLLSYHDPELALHLYRIGFQPELYAIPWFLTLFTHILRMEKIYRLWDVILLNPPSFPLFLAVSIMRELRDSLLDMDFNDAILLFSNLPRLSIDKCIVEGNKLFDLTPVSVAISRLRVAEKSDPLPWDEDLTLEILRQQLSPYISVEDLRNFDEGSMTVIDIRDKEAFEEMHYPGSLHINLKETKLSDLEKLKGTHIVVVSHKSDPDAVKLSNKIVQLHFPYVSLLYGGVEAIRASLENSAHLDG